MKFVSFDVEIATEIPQGADWDKYRPFGISCVATICTGDERPALWFGDGGHYSDPSNPAYGERMSRDSACELVEYLMDMRNMGFVPLGWNSCSFDFHVLAEESGRWKECADLAMGHVDMMLQFFALKGYRCKLDSALRAMGFEGKAASGMTGADAPRLWKTEPEKVLAYVSQDVIQPLRLAEKVEAKGQLVWYNKSGGFGSLHIPRWLTVKECLELPLPDTSWMSDPQPREDFYRWITEYQARKKDVKKQVGDLPLFSILL